MTAPYSGFPPRNVTTQNATPLSQHISNLFRMAKQDPGPGLVLASLAFWAQENLPELDWQQVHPLVEAVLRVELHNAPALYANLAEAPGLMGAPDLKTAAHLMVQHLVSIAPPA